MNSGWQNILTAQGLAAPAPVVAGDGAPGAQESVAHAAGAQVAGLVRPTASTPENVICPIQSETVLQVSGEDAESFLQAQFSNDISVLNNPGSQLTTWSSPKGRVITLLRVVRIADGYLLRLPTDLVEPVLKRLRMYVLMAKVTIEPRNDFLVLGVSGAKAAAVLSEAGTLVPETTDGTSELATGGWITRVRGGGAEDSPRFEIIADSAEVTRCWGELAQTCTAVAETVWRLQNIDAGIPVINAGTTEAFVLQMLNLQFINGVSFKKGCFPGQEVVARMQYLGKLKRQMVRLQCKGSNTPAAGDDIYKAGRDSAVGKVVDAVSIDNNSCRLLAVVAIAELTESLYLDQSAQQQLELLDMPYDISLAD